MTGHTRLELVRVKLHADMSTTLGRYLILTKSSKCVHDREAIYKRELQGSLARKPSGHDCLLAKSSRKHPFIGPVKRA